MPEDIRVGSPLGSLFVEDPDEPQNRMTKYSIVQGEYRDTFTIETDPTRNEGIIKPIKVGKTGAMTLDVGLGAPSIPRTCMGAVPVSEAIRGACLGQLRAEHVLMETVTPELGQGSQGERVGAFGWVTPKTDLGARIWMQTVYLREDPRKPWEQRQVKKEKVNMGLLGEQVFTVGNEGSAPLGASGKSCLRVAAGEREGEERELWCEMRAAPGGIHPALGISH